MDFGLGNVPFGLEGGVHLNSAIFISKVDYISYLLRLAVDELPDDDAHENGANDQEEDDREADDSNFDEFGGP